MRSIVVRASNQRGKETNARYIVPRMSWKCWARRTRRRCASGSACSFDWGRSSVASVWIAGDGAGIGGAKVAENAGELAALDIAAALQRIDTATVSRLAPSHLPLFAYAQ
jgi:hypothetical protein